MTSVVQSSATPMVSQNLIDGAARARGAIAPRRSREWSCIAAVLRDGRSWMNGTSATVVLWDA